MSTKNNQLVCKCGCGQSLANLNSTYRAGHDAKHVSNLIADLFINEHALSGDEQFTESFLFHCKQLPSIPLQNKFTRAVFNKIDKVADKNDLDTGAIDSILTSKTTHTVVRDIEPDGGRHKVGRWDYPTGSMPGDDKNYYNTKRDGSGEWVLINGKDGN